MTKLVCMYPHRTQKLVGMNNRLRECMVFREMVHGIELPLKGWLFATRKNRVSSNPGGRTVRAGRQSSRAEGADSNQLRKAVPEAERDFNILG
jgi:hypothetical protein